MGRVLGMEGFSAFGVAVEHGNHACEGGDDLVGTRPFEWDVFRGDDSLAERSGQREVVGRQTACDLGSEGEAWYPKCRRSIEFV